MWSSRITSIVRNKTGRPKPRRSDQITIVTAGSDRDQADRPTQSGSELEIQTVVQVMHGGPGCRSRVPFDQARWTAAPPIEGINWTYARRCRVHRLKRGQAHVEEHTPRHGPLASLHNPASHRLVRPSLCATGRDIRG